MKKMLQFLLFCAVTAFNNPALCAGNIGSSGIMVDTCYAPAPDSFWITSVSSNFIALAWEPAWVGAEQTLSVLKRNPTGAWDEFLPPFSVPGEAYTVDNLTPGVEYRFIIATNCGLGEPSYIKKKIDGIALILELTIGGRNPVNPVPVDCHNIHYLEHEWVGFKVETTTKEGVAISSMFEFEAIGDNGPNGIINTGKIKRVDYGNPIVATNNYGNWPTIIQPSLQGDNPFRMGHKKDDGITTIPIGRITLTGYPATIDLCADYDNAQDPWRKSYVFTAIVAEAASGIHLPEFAERSSCQPARDMAWANNPFNEYLTIFVPPSINYNAKVFILRSTGEEIMEQNVNRGSSSVSFDTGNFLPGLYFVRIESAGIMQTLKVLKVQ